ncbi:MAG: DUF5686 and carboxypeptidase regulatory-like domain-containing protein [Bacteroidota bacterium]|nr:DUF5686 and carboxypeptidase regulatory-like domain-containing protein [Bacteroidota bacterium]
MSLRNLIILFFIGFQIIINAQIKGKITDKYNTPIAHVNVSIDGSYQNTTSNANGEYLVDIKKEGGYMLIFKMLGYKTQFQYVEVNKQPYILDIQLEEETYQIEQVEISSSENPANRIVREAIKNKKINSSKEDKYTADFYSKGFIKLEDVPKRILGMKVQSDNLDSLGNGIIYLSETVSKITVQKPNKLKEHIIASKISGNSNGFSFNTAEDTDVDLYKNHVNLGNHIISPIADNAFNYYKYNLVDFFYDQFQNIVYRIDVKPKRNFDPVFEGTIYIVEDQYAIYAVDLNIKGYRMNQEFFENLNLIQQFEYNKQDNRRVKTSQIFDLKGTIFNIKFVGTFSYVFSNYQFVDVFQKNTFSAERRSFDKDANKKDEQYWSANRPIPLTPEEVTDYIKKDSISAIKESKVYKDSIDKVNNKFKITSPLLGYSYNNTYKGYRIWYSGIASLVSFNTVQGWNYGTNVGYSKSNKEKGNLFTTDVTFNYGFAENKLRTWAKINYRFNKINYSNISLSGGSIVEQYNDNEPISPFVNTISTLFFKDNYMKLYNKEFVKLAYQQQLITEVKLQADLEYANRKALQNNTDYSFFSKNKSYISNNPLNKNDDELAFSENSIFKTNIILDFNFSREYTSIPNERIYEDSKKYPSLRLLYQKGIATSSSTNYDYLEVKSKYIKNFTNKGTLGTTVTLGKFFNNQNVLFLDYKHFNGNQTHYNQERWILDSYHLLPYYDRSTNDSFVELHAEYHLDGYLTNRIPLFNKLKWNLVAGYHLLSTPNIKPYQEFSIGLDNIGYGIYRFLRIDYLRTYNGTQFLGHGVMFGVTL